MRRYYRRYPRGGTVKIDQTGAIITILIFGSILWLFGAKNGLIVIFSLAAIFVTLVIPIVIAKRGLDGLISLLSFNKRRSEISNLTISNEEPVPVVVENQEPNFYKKEFLSKAESNFYQVLEKIAVDNNWVIQSKVRLEALIGVKFEAENRYGLRNTIKSREMDFVICEKTNLKPVLVIELDDRSHQRSDRVERDENIEKSLREACLPILRVPVSYSYAPETLTQDIKKKIVS